MHVTRLELNDFRNYARCEMAPGVGLNLLLGENAQGKTNLLEAMYTLSTTKSTRARRDVDLIRFGAPATRIAATVVRQGDVETPLELSIGHAGAPGIGAERKIAKVNESRQPRVTDLIGHLNVVLFSASDLDIVRGEPDERRRFLNYEIAQISPRYALALGAYRRALEQRNRLLKEIKYGNETVASLDAWNGPLVEHGTRVVDRRRRYLADLSRHAATIHSRLTQGRETLEVAYEPSFGLDEIDPALLDDAVLDTIRERFSKKLAAVRRDELSRGTTMAGPQRDDIGLKIVMENGPAIDARSFGSQGQQRTVALALRLAERALIEDAIGETPVVLLDDVLSDLDALRRGELLSLALSGGQTFVTATDADALPRDIRENPGGQIWKVERGILERLERVVPTQGG